MSSGFGTVLKLQLFGESHGPAVGMCLDGFPAGFRLDLTALQAFLDRGAVSRPEKCPPPEAACAP